MINLLIRPYDDIIPTDTYWLNIGFRNREIKEWLL